jgi:hypothetical protein
MWNIIKNKFQIFYKLRKKLRLLYKEDSYLVASGYIRSLAEGYPCRRNGDPVPWMNYGVVCFLEERLTKNMSLFEYGSGYSTLFYSRFVGEVISAETDSAWYDRMNKLTGDNVKLVYVDFEQDGAYCSYIAGTGKKYDVIVIDGKDRNRCAQNCVGSLSERGVVIFDDTGSPSYAEGVKFLMDQGFRRLDFEGLKSGGSGRDRTSIFYRDKNCFDI